MHYTDIKQIMNYKLFIIIIIVIIAYRIWLEAKYGLQILKSTFIEIHHISGCKLKALIFMWENNALMFALLLLFPYD